MTSSSLFLRDDGMPYTTNAADLAAVVTSDLANGFLAYVQSLKAIFYLEPTSSAVVDNVTVISASGGGRWLAVSLSSTVTWANDLAGSSGTHQWISGISGASGTGATCVLRSGVTIQQTQTGTLDVPSVETPILIQPVDPAKGAFALRVRGSKFINTTDEVMALGYNIDHPIQSEPECEFVIEQDYENSPGQHQLECYIQLQKFYSGPQIDFIRPLSITYQRQAGGQCFVGVGWLNGGMLNFGGGTQSVPLNEWQLSDGITQIDPATSHGTYVFKCSSTLFSIQSDHGLALSAVGAMEVDMASGQVFSFNSDQITFQTAAHGAKCQLDTTIDSARFFPISSHTGSIGVDSRRWKACFADSLAMQQVTKTAAYVIDSGATPDGVIWVDTSGTPAFALTLPAATVGRVLIVQDIGGNLAAANVTLTRPGGNKINGAAADLALATNRATWEVVSNGTDWITGKSVTGG